MNRDLFEPAAPSRAIAHVYVASGRVVVFDQENREMPQYCGQWDEKREAIERDMPEHVRIR